MPQAVVVGYFAFDEDGLPPDAPRHGLLRLNKRVPVKPKKRRWRERVDPELLEPGALCRRCLKPEAGVKGFDSTPWFYRLTWFCGNCEYTWTETKHEVRGGELSTVWTPEPPPLIANAS